MLVFQPIDHVSVSPTDGIRPTQGQRKFPTTCPRLVRVFLCPCVGPIPSVGLTLTWSMGWNTSTLHYILSLNSFLIQVLHGHTLLIQRNPLLLIRVHTTLLASMCHAMPFWTRALKKKTFSLTFIPSKNKSKCGFVVCTLIDNGYASLLFFPKNVFLLFLHVERVCKSFCKESWPVQVAHLHNAARALSSRNRCFQLSTNLKKDFFRCL